MYTETNYFAEDGTEFDSAAEALEYERPWLEANLLLEAGKNLFEVINTLTPTFQCDTESKELLRNISTTTPIHWRRYKNQILTRKVISITLEGKIALLGSEPNTGLSLTPNELITHICQFRPTMQTLNLHDVKSVIITPMQEFNTSRWKIITITYEGGEFQITLFPETNAIDIPITIEEPPK